MVFFLTLLSRLPLSLLYFMGDVVAFLSRRYYRRKVVEENLRECFPGLSAKEIKEVADKFYFRLASFLVETLKGLTISERELKRRVKYINPETANEVKEKGGPLLVFAAHQMNWEWMALASSFYFPFPSEVIYRPLTNETSERLMLRLRSRFGSRPIKRDQCLRHILKNKQKTRAIGIVADQLPRQKMDKIWTMFLNRETPFFKGLSELPYLTQSKAVFAHVRVKKRGFYELEFTEIGRPPYEKGDLGVLRNYIIESEKLIKSAPENWLWSHRRWKYPRGKNEELIIL